MASFLEFRFFGFLKTTVDAHPRWFWLKSVQLIEGIGVARNLELMGVCKVLKTHVGLWRTGTTERDGLLVVEH